MNIDAQILLWINNHYCEWLDSVMWAISRASTWIPLYMILVGLVVYKYRNWKAVLFILVGFGSGCMSAYQGRVCPSPSMSHL
jgi:undecaprenyl-diphosphatase